VSETACNIASFRSDVILGFNMKIISYPYKNHLLDDFQEVLKSYMKDEIILGFHIFLSLRAKQIETN